MRYNVQIHIAALLGAMIAILFLIAGFATGTKEPFQAAGIIAAFTLVLFLIVEET